MFSEGSSSSFKPATVDRRDASRASRTVFVNSLAQTRSWSMSSRGAQVNYLQEGNGHLRPYRHRNGTVQSYQDPAHFFHDNHVHCDHPRAIPEALSTATVEVGGAVSATVHRNSVVLSDTRLLQVLFTITFHCNKIVYCRWFPV